MKKFLLLIAAVIILVCLNWFTEALAQDLSQFSAEERESLRKRVAGNQLPSRENRQGRYQSPIIFDSTISPRIPNDSLAARPKIDSLDERHLRLRNDVTRSQITPFENLKPFGMGLFRGPRENRPPDDIATDAEYILGPGDNVIVYLWGRVEKEYNLTLDRRGVLFIPQAGEISAWGISIEDFEDLLHKKLSVVYTDFKLAVSLGRIRSIRIYVTGEVNRPGAYSVSSLTSLFNALYLAGGPNQRGSMRDIRLMRNGKRVASVDLYRFLLSGDNSSDIRLQTGDAIFIPVAGTRVAIRGEVVRQALYELSEDETATDLLSLAGGATPQSYLERVMLETITDRGEWEVIDLNLRGQTNTTIDKRPLTDGDRITIFSIFEFKKNMVSIFGQVKHPGYFERTDSTRLSELISRAQLQEYDVHYERANLYRRHSDWRTEVIAINLRSLLAGQAEQDPILRDRDSVHIYSMSDVSYERYVYIEGEVRSPGRYPVYDQMTLDDLIFLAGSFTRGASRLQAEIARVETNGQVQLLYANLMEEADRHTPLIEDDRVYIRPIPMWHKHRAVELVGSVLYPGEYILRGTNETLYQLLQRAGGFADNAFPAGTVFERRSIGETLERLQVPSLLERSSSIERDSVGNLQRNVLFEYEPGAVNRLIIDVSAIVESEGREGDVVLEPGDRVFVPNTPSGISVLGAVGAQGTITFRRHQKVKDYIKLAGNFTPHADKKNTRLIRANGTVYASNGTLGHRVEIGDVIVVPSKIREKKSFTKSLSTVLTTTTGLLTTILLLDRL